MPYTPHQAKYFAHLLTRRTASNDREKLMGVVMDAQVEPKPHQIDAALFAFRSPFSKGAILADEVGLGKTIEAGIVLSQYWAEHKRKLLIIAPANLRQQWAGELRDKFYMDSEIVDSKKINESLSNNKPLFDKQCVYIISYDFARRFSELLTANGWDLLVIDEAHRLRNVYKTDNVTANIIKDAFESVPKLLLTATPLQNSLLELYGLVSIVDKNYFGSLEAFKEEYVTGLGTGQKASRKLVELQKRLHPLLNRSLRSQVQEYINYTKRKPITQTFTPSPQEVELYEHVTEYLNRPELYAFASSQRTLTTLLILKLLGSSSHAIAVTLDKLATRVELEAKEGIRRDARGHKIFDEDIESTLSEEIEDDTDDIELSPTLERKLSPVEIDGMRLEASELRQMAKLARAITNESKAAALQQALGRGFQEMTDLNANKKAIIFTESTRTQDYLVETLNKGEFAGKVIAFNGSGGGEQGAKIYQEWLQKHQGSDKVSGVRSADQRAAIVEYFRDYADIMVATEAAGEGINLQFCSLVINYDLPWNPQRVEQRIGRCHRYGQKSDVIVINFLNENNRAEQRILELLTEKFQLFSGVFGASDQILGAIESGFDFERRIADIVRTCRSTTEIESSFDKLQDELSDKISSKMQSTRKALIDNLDVAVQEKLRISRDESNDYLSRYEQRLWELLKYSVSDIAELNDVDHSLKIRQSNLPGVPAGSYYLGNDASREGHKIRLHHPIAIHTLENAKAAPTPGARLTFVYTGSNMINKAMEPHIGDSGTLTIQRYALSSEVQTEEHFIVIAKTRTGKLIPSDVAERMLELPAMMTEIKEITGNYATELNSAVTSLKKKTRERDQTYLKEEGTKLDAWAADMRRAAKAKISKLDGQIRELKKDVRAVVDIESELAIRQQLRKLEKRRDEQEFDYRQKIKEIDTKTDELLDIISNSLQATESLEEIYTVEWGLI